MKAVIEMELIISINVIFFCGAETLSSTLEQHHQFDLIKIYPPDSSHINCSRLPAVCSFVCLFSFRTI